MFIISVKDYSAELVISKICADDHGCLCYMMLDLRIIGDDKGFYRHDGFLGLGIDRS
jgi:hypothetical protein